MGFQIRGVVTGLTPAEKAYLLLHPHHIGPIGEAADKARAEARVQFPGAGLHNGRGDAFRHCYWSALLARDIGPDNALAFTTAHEDYGSNPPGEKAMDLHNNAVGVAIGRQNPSASDQALVTLCVQATYNGRLITSLTDTRPGRYGY